MPSEPSEPAGHHEGGDGVSRPTGHHEGGDGASRPAGHHENGDGVSRPTVAIVDDHELLVQTVVLALASVALDGVAVRPREPEALLAALTAVAPDVVLLDLDLGPFGDATSAIAPLADAGVQVVVLTGQTDRIRMALALEQGAVGIQPKSAGFEELVAAARMAVTGVPIHPAETAALRAELAAHRHRTREALAPFHRLTDREQATLRELADGRTVQDIARAWVVSTATVRSHVQAVLRKLDATSQLQAVAAARQSGWLDGAPIGMPDDAAAQASRAC